MHMALPLADEIQRVLAGRQACSTHEPSYTLEPDLKVTRCCYPVSSTVPKLASGARRPGSMISATTLTMTPSSFAAGLASRLPNHSRLSAGRKDWSLISQGGERLGFCNWLFPSDIADLHGEWEKSTSQQRSLVSYHAHAQAKSNTFASQKNKINDNVKRFCFMGMKNGRAGPMDMCVVQTQSIPNYIIRRLTFLTSSLTTRLI